MVENKNVCEVCGSGDGRCGQCGNMCGYRGNHLLRWILGIIIITWVFSIGMKFGEMKTYLEQSGYGRGGNGFYKTMPMMGGTYPVGGQWSGEDVIYSTSATPATMMGTGAVRVIKSN
ncbi:MAG: hypothetical protein CEO12_22 [Parcubacteria group bacterium Gr01-1014_46]|nr:MAG: hypothetical protein CEO12_22 [Parcubacteria group bacterium Gr01-1014_46]